MRTFNWSGIHVIDHTTLFDLTSLHYYIQKALSCVPGEDLKLFTTLNFYDKCPMHFPIGAMGGYYAATAEKGAEIDIYVDESLGHMSSLHRRRGKITELFDYIFVHTFGKTFIAATIFHEMGHLVFDAASSSGDPDKDASEEYAENYVPGLYGKLHPFQQRHYAVFNVAYHLLYRHRIAHSNRLANERSVQRAAAPDRQETAPAAR